MSRRLRVGLLLAAAAGAAAVAWQLARPGKAPESGLGRTPRPETRGSDPLLAERGPAVAADEAPRGAEASSGDSARERPSLPSGSSYALRGIDATEVEAQRIEQIRAERSRQIEETDRMPELSREERLARNLDILAREDQALADLLGDERAERYTTLRAEEASANVVDLLGGHVNPEPAQSPNDAD